MRLRSVRAHFSTACLLPRIGARAWAGRRPWTRGGVTRVELKLGGALPAGALVQGYAYGLPARRAAITRPQRHVLDRFAY